MKYYFKKVADASLNLLKIYRAIPSRYSKRMPNTLVYGLCKNSICHILIIRYIALFLCLQYL